MWSKHGNMQNMSKNCGSVLLLVRKVHRHDTKFHWSQGWISEFGLQSDALLVGRVLDLDQTQYTPKRCCSEVAAAIARDRSTESHNWRSKFRSGPLLFSITLAVPEEDAQGKLRDASWIILQHRA